MKSTQVIIKTGYKFNQEFAQTIIPQILGFKGCKYNKNQHYELWGCSGKDNVKILYIIKGEGRKEVVTDIKPTHANLYFNENIDQYEKILQRKQEEVQSIEKKLQQLKEKQEEEIAKAEKRLQKLRANSQFEPENQKYLHDYLRGVESNE